MVCATVYLRTVFYVVVKSTVLASSQCVHRIPRGYMAMHCTLLSTGTQLQPPPPGKEKISPKKNH